MTTSDGVNKMPAHESARRRAASFISNIVITAVGLSAAIGLVTPALAAEKCKPLQRITTIDMTYNDNGAVIPATIANRSVHLVLDTGAFLSVMSEPLADELGLLKDRAMDMTIRDAANRSIRFFVKLPFFQVGGLKTNQAIFFLTDGFSAKGTEEDPAGVFGGDFLRNFDLDLDFAAAKLGLYAHNYCKEGQVVHWSDDHYGVVDLRAVKSSRTQITAEVILDGQKMRALIDTGAGYSSMTLATAKKRFKLDPNSPGVGAGGSATAMTGTKMDAYGYVFNSLTVGDVQFQNAPFALLRTSDSSEHDIILGMNELKKMHIYLAYAQNKMYVTPAE